MKTKCYSVRLESFYRISDKCYKAVSFDGSEALIPASQVWWISAWILEKKDIQYSTKKVAHFYSDTGKRAPDIEVITHVPEAVVTAPVEADEQLTRP